MRMVKIATWGDDDSDLPGLGRFVIQHFGIGDFTSGAALKRI